MIIHKVLLPIFLFVRSELAKKVDGPCSKFDDFWGDDPLVKCPSEKVADDYLECYDLDEKEYFENIDGYKSGQFVYVSGHPVRK